MFETPELLHRSKFAARALDKNMPDITGLVWMDVKKSREELRPACQIHTGYDFLKYMMTAKGMATDGMVKNMPTRSVRFNGHALCYISGRELRWGEETKKFLSTEEQKLGAAFANAEWLDAS